MDSELPKTANTYEIKNMDSEQPFNPFNPFMNKGKSIKEQLWSYTLIVLGCALFAVGDVMFVNPYLMAPGGTYGLSNVLNTVWPWKISLYAICMDVPLLLIGTWILGPKFGAKTIVSTILIFVFTFLLETLWGYNPLIHGDMSATAPQIGLWTEIPHNGGWFEPDYILNTIVAGIIYGVAIGMIFKSGATSGGSDIIAMVVHKYVPHLSLGTLVLVVDSCITLTSFVAFKDIRLPIYSILLIYIESKVIDLIVEGRKSYKTVFIVSDQVEAIRDYVVKELERGGTCFSGEGLYKGAQRRMIYVTLDRADLIKLRANLGRLDPNAFVNIMDSSEILGLGFRAIPTEDK